MLTGVSWPLVRENGCRPIYECFTIMYFSTTKPFKLSYSVCPINLLSVIASIVVGKANMHWTIVRRNLLVISLQRRKSTVNFIYLKISLVGVNINLRTVKARTILIYN